MASVSGIRSSFVGRHAERAFIHDVLVKPDVRLLTLTGPGGVGKTRLAMALIAELAPEFVDGADFVALRELRDADLVLAAIARAIGMPAYGATPVFERLCSRLADADLLLVLDQLEHDAAATPDLVRLLEACPWVTILVTSRTPLHVDWELVFPLTPLQIPDLDRLPTLEDLRENEAVKLLVQRAQAADPAFALTEANAAEIAEICARLGGVPVAIELAAARLQVFSPAALLERLYTRVAVFARGDPQIPLLQQTLHNVIAWSDRLISAASRSVFYRLSVFANGCDAAAAEAICVDPPANQTLSNSVLDALAELLDHGLLQQEVAAGEPRFMMSETIREYARERLEATGKSETTHRRHALYFLAVAEEMAAELLGPDQEIVLARFDREHHNIRAALEWSLAQAPTIGLRLATELWRFWYARGCFIEGQRCLEGALATPVAEKSIVRVRALHGLGVMVWATGNLDRALDLLNTSLALACEIDDPWGIAAAQGDRAIIKFLNGGDAAQARKATRNALKKFRALGDGYSEGLALTALGNIAQSQGNLVRATYQFQEALAVTRQNGDRRSQLLCLFNLGQTARLEGDLDRSAAYHHEGLALAHRQGLQEDMLYSLAGIAGVAVDRGQFKRAARLQGAVQALSGRMGISFQPMEQAQLDHEIATTRAAVADKPFTRAWEAGRGIALEDAVAEALELTQPPDRLGNGRGLTDQRLYGHHPNALYSERALIGGQRKEGDGSVDQFKSEHGLSQRELEVLPLLVAGSSDREIAEELSISRQTATTHVKRIRAKLAVHSRAAVAAYAIRHGIA
jgi:predicted ATPase/DNA-binding CsgD family transcriptional regulator